MAELTPSGAVDALSEKVEALSGKAAELSFTLLYTDDNCIDNLKTEIESIVKELNSGITELSGYASTMEDNKVW